MDASAAMRVTTALLLTALPSAAFAQIATVEDLLQARANLRLCIRANAPAAEAAGVQTRREADSYFRKACIPPLAFTLDGPQATKETLEAIRKVVRIGEYGNIIAEEWSAFIAQNLPL